MTGLVENVSTADAVSTIVGRSRIEIPALAADRNSAAAAGPAGLPVNVAVPADALKGIRWLKLCIHVPLRDPRTQRYARSPISVNSRRILRTAAHSWVARTTISLARRPAV